jgi:small-conductance mechanosensitive channel
MGSGLAMVSLFKCLRLTDNWLELTVRFLVQEHGIRELKDVMSREIVALFEAAHIAIASSTLEVVGLPSVRVSASQISIKQEPP